MPPKKKPASLMAAAATSAVETVTPPPAAPKPSIFSVNSADMYGVSYFCEGNKDFAEGAFHINGVLCDDNFA